MTVLMMGTTVSCFSVMAHTRVMPPLTTTRCSPHEVGEGGCHGESGAAMDGAAPKERGCHGECAVMGATLGVACPSAPPEVGVAPGQVWDQMRAAAPKRRPLAIEKEGWMGKWLQESIDGDGLDASLKAEGTPFLIRKMVKSIKRKVEVEVDSQGFVVMKAPIPTAGTVDFRVQETKEIAVRSPVRFSIMGIDMAVHTYWEGQMVVQTTVKSTTGMSDRTARVVYQLDDESVAGRPRMLAREESESGSYGWVLGNA